MQRNSILVILITLGILISIVGMQLCNQRLIKLHYTIILCCQRYANFLGILMIEKYGSKLAKQKS